MKNILVYSFLLFIANICCKKSFAQATNSGPGSPNLSATGNEYIGWNANLFNPLLVIQTTNPDPIHFHTDITTAPGTRMIILPGGTTALGGGYVGIGYNHSPLWQLDVVEAININPTIPVIGGVTGYYMIGGGTVLHNFGNNNIFTGIGSGNFTLTGVGNTANGLNSGTNLSTGSSNVFIGTLAGFDNTTGSENVFIGFTTGLDNIMGVDNTFVGTRAGELNRESANTYVGHHSGLNGVTAVHNTFVGAETGELNTEDDNTFIGFWAGLLNTTGPRNTFIGSLSGASNTTGNDNTFVGQLAGSANTTARENTFIGADAGSTNTTSAANTFVGFQAGMSSTSASNTLIGHIAGTAINTGANNTIVGTSAGSNTTTGANNTFIGKSVAVNNISGSNNTFIGNTAAASNTTGSNNTVLGDGANCDATFSNQVAIGNGAVATTASTMILGNNINVGIGLSNDPTGIGPFRKLEIFNPYNSSSNPHLRLSTRNITGLLRFTDLETTDAGDFIIRPRGGLLSTSARSVGINTSTPGKTLEINSNDLATTPIIGFGPATGNSGLKLTDLTTSSIPQANQFSAGNHAVLSVDNVGNVILVPDDGTTGVTTCGPAGPGSINYITKYTNATEICATSRLWENDFTAVGNTYVGISTITPRYTLHNCTTAMFSPLSLGAALGQHESRAYPLAVQSLNTASTTATGYAGLAVYGGIGTAIRDELNIYVNDANGICFESRFVYTDFHVRPSASAPTISNLGFNPAQGCTVIKNDFATSPTPPFTTRLFVEAQDRATPMEYAIHANHDANFQLTTQTSIGIFGSSYQDRTNYGATINTGGRFRGANASRQNFGVKGEADACDIVGGCLDDPRGVTYGGHFVALNSVDANFGVWSEALSHTVNNYGIRAAADNASAINYAVYGETNTLTPCTLAGVCSNAAGYFKGNLVHTGSFGAVSDSKFKTDVNTIDSAAYFLSQIQTHSFNFDHVSWPQMALPQGKHYGVIAQELETILPDAITNYVQPGVVDSTGAVVHPNVSFKAVNYLELIPLLVKGYQLQQLQIDSLSQALSSCCQVAPKPSGNLIDGDQTKQTVELRDVTTIILRQNVPNPFAEETDITYVLPTTVKSAKILIFDKSGNVLKTVELKERGEGTLHVYAPDLSSGTYSYSLIADGKVIDTKTMVKSR